MKTTLRTSRDIDSLSLDLKRSALRVVQEALLNAHKHASATRVSIHAKVTRGALVLRVYDNGRGIAGLVTNGSTQGEGIQLRCRDPGDARRLRQFGGDLVIRTKRHGTTVLAAVSVTLSGLSKGEVTVVGDETEQLELGRVVS